jgi:hypothetical protein
MGQMRMYPRTPMAVAQLAAGWISAAATGAMAENSVTAGRHRQAVDLPTLQGRPELWHWPRNAHGPVGLNLPAAAAAE